MGGSHISNQDSSLHGYNWGFPGGSSGKEPALPSSARDMRDAGSIPGLGKSPEGGQPTPVFMPREPHGQRSLVGYGP